MDKKNMKQLFKEIVLNNVTLTMFIFTISFINVYSQDLKLSGIQYSEYSNSEIKKDSEQPDISFQEFGAFINLPKKLKNNKTLLINGFGYGFVEASLDTQLFPSMESNKTLQTFYYRLTLIQQWNENWNILFNVTPTLASDFEGQLSADDFVFQGAVVVTRTINSTLKIGSGIAYSTRFGTPRPVPLINLQYKNNKHQINTLLPLNLKYSYNLSPKDRLKIGFQCSLDGANFNTLTTGTNNIDEINYSRANIGALIDYKITKMLRLEAYGGLSAARRYTVIDTDSTEYNFDSETAPFFSLGIVLIPKKKQ